MSAVTSPLVRHQRLLHGTSALLPESVASALDWVLTMHTDWPVPITPSRFCNIHLSTIIVHRSHTSSLPILISERPHTTGFDV